MLIIKFYFHQRKVSRSYIINYSLSDQMLKIHLWGILIATTNIKTVIQLIPEPNISSLSSTTLSVDKKLYLICAYALSTQNIVNAYISAWCFLLSLPSKS